MSDDEEDGKPQESDFDRFLKGGSEGTLDSKTAGEREAEAEAAADAEKAASRPGVRQAAQEAEQKAAQGKDAFMDKVADYQAKNASKERAASEENLDPVKQQAAQEVQAEKDRKDKLRALNVPENMMDHVAADDVAMNLVPKGQTIDLIQKVPSLRKLYIGAGWTAKALDEEIDIDLSVFLLNKNDTTARDTDVVFYNQMTTYDGSIKHEGDNRTGAGEGDEEGIFIDLNGIPFDIVKIMIVLSCYDELEVGYHLGQVRNMYVRLSNREYNEEICRFQLAEEYKDNTAIYVGALVREGPRWLFETLGTGIGRGGLPNVATRYGIVVKELQSSG